MRRRIVDEGIRLDGRRPDELRQITCPVAAPDAAAGSLVEETLRS
jgi:polyribonucleotide nucleotidyltransferase